MISSCDAIPRRLSVPDAQKEIRLRVGKLQEYIDRQDALDEFIKAARDASWIAVDTEFERVRTFYPRLCLIQLAIPTTSACIDPLADLDLQGLSTILCDSAAVKIFHAARQDLEVLQHALGIVPNHLFDTQIAAAMGGHGDRSNRGGRSHRNAPRILAGGWRRYVAPLLDAVPLCTRARHL